MQHTRPEESALGMSPDLPESRRVTQRNWTLPPFNRWSFQNVQQLTCSCRAAGRSDAPAMPERLQDIAAVSWRRADGTATTFAAMAENTWTDGLLVMHEGCIVYETYLNGMQADTLHLLMSCSKSMTSSLVGIAIHDGLLDRTAIVSDYLPELSDTAMADASIGHLLDMQVGLAWDEDYSDLDGDWRHLEVASGWRPPGPSDRLPSDQLSYMRTLNDRQGVHGAQFHYQSVLTDVLGLCLERAMNEPFASAFQRLIWQPIGAAHDLVSIVDAGGFPAFEGGFNCTLRDFARFAGMIANGGCAADGTRVVPDAWIRDCRFPDGDLVTTFAVSEYAAAMPGHAYHNCWWVRDPGRGVIMALGIHGQIAYIDPEREFVAVKFSSQPEHVDMDMTLQTIAGFEAVADTLCR